MKRHLVVCLAVTVLILTGYAPAHCDSWSLSLGGYSADIANDSLPTTLNNSLSVDGGTARVDSVTVKGVLTIKGGSLQVSGVVVK